MVDPKRQIDLELEEIAEGEKISLCVSCITIDGLFRFDQLRRMADAVEKFLMKTYGHVGDGVRSDPCPSCGRAVAVEDWNTDDEK